ncbi:hypothetical protein AC578_8555 [Pseudocercospora eumusae]|uniref:Uncharacterized protein n=1 Tax=Pseudocercospora eumusae TaxID=321146 RepID=A0A139HW58_9PEZI|nr:hypothetical protein AC578_8555 [Pseudocercospora eumusae]
MRKDHQAESERVLSRATSTHAGCSGVESIEGEVLRDPPSSVRIPSLEFRFPQTLGFFGLQLDASQEAIDGLIKSSITISDILILAVSIPNTAAMELNEELYTNFRHLVNVTSSSYSH